MNYRDTCIENLKRCNEEIGMWNDLEGIPEVEGIPLLNLKRIPIQAKNINDHEHTQLNKTSRYLVCYDGRWLITGMYRNYHNTGWKFDVGLYSSGIAGISMIYEILNLPIIPKILIDRIEFEDEDEIPYEEDQLSAQQEDDRFRRLMRSES